MMYSTYNLNKQSDDIQPWCIHFPVLNQSFVPWLILTVASRPACRFLRRQVRWSGIPISLRIFPQFVVIHTIKGFSVVNEAEVDVCVCVCVCVIISYWVYFYGEPWLILWYQGLACIWQHRRQIFHSLFKCLLCFSCELTPKVTEWSTVRESLPRDVPWFLEIKAITK